MRSRGIHRLTFRPRARYVAVAVAVAATALAAAAPTGTAGAATGRPAGPPTTEAAAAGENQEVARYGFDERSASVLDQSGHGHTLRLLTRDGGRTRFVVHSPGQAVAFPTDCATGDCPRAVLQSASSADLNPGIRPLAFGAAVNLPANRTSKGQNLVQKGYSASGSQYKLQIDGTAGKPSCVLVDDHDPTIRLVRSSRTVADGTWHTLECRRIRAALSILVDGVVQGSGWVPGTLSVTNDRPLSIGGKGVFADNDQFHGALDDVWVRVG